MDIEKTPLAETLDLLEDRVNFFSTQRLSAENILNSHQNAYSVHSLSEIVPKLASYELNPTPIHMSLADIYLGREAVRNQFENNVVNFILPPVSEG